MFMIEYEVSAYNCQSGEKDIIRHMSNPMMQEDIPAFVSTLTKAGHELISVYAVCDEEEEMEV